MRSIVSVMLANVVISTNGRDRGLYIATMYNVVCSQGVARAQPGHKLNLKN